LFCGIGVCFDCLVVADGRPNQRACLLPARPGLEVTTQEGTGHDDLAI
jgi:aerobic-type carbon monoxide dehydrogenase small subunit (CoxS/CutS family)